jgi:hypothetical protein
MFEWLNIDRGRLDRERQHYLDRVKPRSGGDVEIKIGVMDAMQPPQQRHRVKHDVLQVNREIEGKDHQQDLHGQRQVEAMQQADSAPLREQRDSHRGSRGDGTDHDSVYD